MSDTGANERVTVRLIQGVRRRLARSRSGRLTLVAQRVAFDPTLQGTHTARYNKLVTIRRR